jgi:hypothetical protein
METRVQRVINNRYTLVWFGRKRVFRNVQNGRLVRAFYCITPASEIKREYRRLRRTAATATVATATAAAAVAALPAAAGYNDLSTLFDGRFPLASSRATHYTAARRKHTRLNKQLFNNSPNTINANNPHDVLLYCASSVSRIHCATHIPECIDATLKTSDV